MNCLYNGPILYKDQILEGKALVFDSKVREIIDEDHLTKDSYEHVNKINAEGNLISPGLMDIHFHGYQGYDIMSSDPQDLISLAQKITANGVTSFLATTNTAPLSSIESALDTIRKLKNKNIEGAEILGAHLEGPFLSPLVPGAQDPSSIIPPSFEWLEPYTDLVYMITIAPEVPGALSFIDQVCSQTNITVSMGHTNATYEETLLGIKAGISHATHFFNAMTGLHHRNPGVVGAVLSSNHVTCELIADTIHVHPGLFSLLLKTKGAEDLVLITDCVPPAELPDGTYLKGDRWIESKDGQIRLPDGTLSGSSLRLNQGVKNFKQHTNCSISEAIQLASLNPAKVIGLDNKKGSLELGKDADIAIFDVNFNTLLTFVNGNLVYRR